MKFLKNIGGAMAPPLLSVAPPLDPLDNKLGTTNSKRPFKPNLPNVPKSSNLLL